jgi:hypothetical protein
MDPVTQAVIFVAALLAVVIGILAVLYAVVQATPPQPQRKSYRRHRPWNFK